MCVGGIHEEITVGASLHDRAVISDLVSRVRELSEQPFNEVRRRRWRKCNSLGVTPWADVGKCAEKIGGRYSISWRPNPAHLAGDFNEAFIRSYLRHGLAALKGCAFHVFLKDIHSCGGRPERLTRWTQILNEEIERLWGG